MKKLFIITKITVLILIGATIAQAKVSPEALAAGVEREAAKHLPVYVNDRVKTMCQEWPGCEEWAKSRVAQDSSFLLVDAEVEHWVSSWQDNQAVWQHRFYVQTRENSKIQTSSLQPLRIVTLMGNIENSETKAYRFELEKNGKKHTSSAPVQIPKFPGHPIPGKPSNHARYVRSFNNTSLLLCQKWQPCEELRAQKDATVGKAVESQYIRSYDKGGNALWARTLYVQFYYMWGTSGTFVFRAHQEKAEGPYIYQPVHEVNKCPAYPDFHIIK